MATETLCEKCGGLVDHRSPVINKSWYTSIRECIHCGYHQRCEERKVSDQNLKYLYFLDKLLRSKHLSEDDDLKCQWLREEITSKGYVPVQHLGEFRRLQKKYDTEI